MTGSAISCRDLSVSFGSLKVVDSICLDIAEREIVAIMGPSGSGKSTLLRTIAGLQPASDGTVKVFGAQVSTPIPELRYLFQDFDSYPWLTVRANVARGVTASTFHNVEKVLESVGLSGFENAMPYQLSGGMRKRLGFARALAAQARVVLLDEPFSSLDVNARADLYSLLHQVNQEYKCTFVIVTHDVDEAVYLSDRIIIGSSRPFGIREIVSAHQFGFPRHAHVHMDTEYEAVIDQVRTLLRVTDAQQRNGRDSRR